MPAPSIQPSAPGREAGVSTDRAPVATGKRLILLTVGITERHTEDGARFGAEGLGAAVKGVASPTAVATAMAIQRAVADSWAEPLEDDATVVVLAVE